MIGTFDLHYYFTNNKVLRCHNSQGSNTRLLYLQMNHFNFFDIILIIIYVPKLGTIGRLFKIYI